MDTVHNELRQNIVYRIEIINAQLNQYNIKECVAAPTNDTGTVENIHQICYPSLCTYHGKVLDPYQMKLFHDALIMVNDVELIKIENNPTYLHNIHAVLVCTNNQTYGKRKNRNLYKCIPDDRRLPHFVVPYKVATGFTKHMKNKYVTIGFDNWDNKHPEGILKCTIGDVDNLQHYAEYRMGCKHLNNSIKNFSTSIAQVLKHNSRDEYLGNICASNPNIEDRRDVNVFTIDGATTMLFDDALSYRYIPDTKLHIVSVYITNVSAWVDAVDTWMAISSRTATVYLPNQYTPMLPPIFTSQLCNLREQVDNIALTLDIGVNEDGTINYTVFSNTLVCVKKNYEYNDKRLTNNPDYKNLLQCVKNMCIHVDMLHTKHIHNSRNVVSYLMLLFNKYAADVFRTNSIGIYRLSVLNPSKTRIPRGIDDDILKFATTWNSRTGEYATQLPDINANIIDTSTHITSPMWRIVDLINITILQQLTRVYIFKTIPPDFINKWTSPAQIAHINESMRHIRKLQTDCSLLHLVDTKYTDTSIKHAGYIVAIIEVDENTFKYTIYSTILNILVRTTSTLMYTLFDKCLFTMYAFKDEHTFTNKIKVQLE